jgi:phosphotriesterase-related protein
VSAAAESMVGRVNTVFGPVEASTLGIVLPHEHLLIDVTNWLMDSDRVEIQAIRDAPVSLENLHLVRRNPHSSRDNLIFDDVALQTREAQRFKDAGGDTIVDVSIAGIARNPVGCAQIARDTGLNVILGCGYYIQSAHPPEVREKSIDELADLIVAELTEGIGDTGIKAGVIGEIGTFHPIHPDEEKSLRAAGRAQLRTGAPIWVHLDSFARWGHRVLDILIEEGVDPRRVVLNHLDFVPEWIDYQMSLADRGAYVEYDTFGIDWTNDDRRANERAVRFIPPAPTDYQRILALKQMVDAGYTERMLLSHDVSVKLHLTAYGGWGYAHLLENLVPLMLDVGIRQGQVDTMMQSNPQQVLAWTEPPAG